MSTRLQPLVSLAVLAFAAGCDETFISVSSDGRIEVAVSTNRWGRTPPPAPAPTPLVPP